MPELDGIILRPFRPDDQDAARALILAGLVDHWGVLDPTRNPDLNDIAGNYAGAHFLVACRGEEIVGTGACVPRSADVAEIVRMSVKKELRGCGLGGRILRELLDHARSAGFRRIVLETTETWSEVIAFYQRFGFQITHHQDGDAYFALELD
jgi:GNAT superfamily N-acetyltransferase